MSSHSNSICKTLIVLVLLLAIQFFPSEAPDYISQTILTQFWEILHLLFVGIAVSYGLFGRKSEKIGIPRNDNPDAYLSGISHLYSIFEDGFGNICCGTDVIQSYYANCDCQCFGDQFLGKSKCVVHEGSCSSTKIRSFRGNEIFYDSNEENVNQKLNSKYLICESLVVVSKGEDFLGESFEFKPLNLPVRSLRSNVVDDDKRESRNGNNSSPKIAARGENDVKVIKIRGMVPLNLEKNFDEADVLFSIPWQSKSGKMENEEVSNTKPRVHFKPHSVGGFEFEHIRSIRSNKVAKISSSTELEISEVGKFEGEMVISPSRPKISPLDDKVSVIGSMGRPFSVVDDFEVDNESGKGKQLIESLDSDTKALSRAKSVRTKEHIMNQKEQCSSRINRKLEDFKANSFLNRENKKCLRTLRATAKTRKLAVIFRC